MTVASTVVSGVSAVLLHMKFGPPGMPPTVMLAGVLAGVLAGLLAARLVSATPFDVPPQSALPLWQVQLAEVSDLVRARLAAAGLQQPCHRSMVETRKLLVVRPDEDT